MAAVTGAEGRAVFERRGPFRVWRQDSVEAEALLGQLLPDPDHLFAQGEELSSPWRGEATDKVRVTHAGREYFLKRYNCGGWAYRLKNAFRRSRARRSWLAVRRFVERQVPTPAPLLCLEERRLRLLGRSFLLFPFIAGEAGSFLDLWPRLTGTQRHECLSRLGEIVGRMHHRGLLHGDLNWRNILAAREGGGLRFYLVDLDGSRLVTTMSQRQAVRDLDHFLRDLERSGAGPELREAFLGHWRRAANSAVPSP